MTRLAAVQLHSRQDPQHNLRRVAELAARAAEEADIVVVPEMFPFIGAEGREVDYAKPVGDLAYIEALIRLSDTRNCHIVAGSIPVAAGPGRIYNRSYVISQGRVLGYYDKIHLFDITISSSSGFSESAYTTPGKDMPLFDLGGVKLAIAVCFDLRFPEMFRQYRKLGADIIALPAAFLTHTGKDHWEVLLRARAIENQVYVIAANQYGRHTEHKRSYGRSMIVHPWGTVLACAPDGETWISADYDGEELAAQRRRLPVAPV